MFRPAEFINICNLAGQRECQLQKQGLQGCGGEVPQSNSLHEGEDQKQSDDLNHSFRALTMICMEPRPSFKTSLLTQTTRSTLTRRWRSSALSSTSPSTTTSQPASSSSATPRLKGSRRWQRWSLSSMLPTKRPGSGKDLYSDFFSWTNFSRHGQACIRLADYDKAKESFGKVKVHLISNTYSMLNR